MDNYASVKYFIDCETVGEYRHERQALVSEERRKIPRMRGMWAVIRVVMCAYVSKGIFFVPGAGPRFVNVHSVNIRRAGIIILRESVNICHDKDTVLCLVKTYVSDYRRIFGAPFNRGTGIRGVS